MASLRKRLQNLFATNVIVRAYGKDQIKVVDTNRLQSSTGNLNQTKVADRYTRLHGSNRHRVGGMVDMILIIICIKIVCSYTLITK
jgi:hypothetical protein